MAVTLCSLCDKLTIVKLKQYHTEDLKRLESLESQERQLSEEIDAYVRSAANGDISQVKWTFYIVIAIAKWNSFLNYLLIKMKTLVFRKGNSNY